MDTSYQETVERLTKENAELIALLRQIATNAPDVQPFQLEPKTLPQAHSFWVAGQQAKSLLAMVDRNWFGTKEAQS